MLWCCHGRLHERIGHVVDIKMDNIPDEHGHIKNMLKNYCRIHICCYKKNYSLSQQVGTRKLQSYIKYRYLLACVIE